VSVVVPVYNASVALRACLEWLERTTPAEVPVVLVDDCSSDAAARSVCDKFAARRATATVIASKRNRGFVATVNTGVRHVDADHDVVLLNSDTLVTDGWLHKLATAAYIAADVASASPLSNAAGVFSLPREHVDNALPDGWSAAACNLLLEEVAEREYEQVPATSGFCLYLRRAALDAVGLFDELLLQRGYGEENDFCARATAAGFQHRIDDATFVFHERNASFGGDKWDLKRQNARLVKAFHPDHARELEEWEHGTSLGMLRSRFGRALEDLARQPPEPVATTLVVGGEDMRPAWDGASRTAVMKVDRSRCEIDLFGLRQLSLRLAPELRAGAIAWLLNRWQVGELRLATGVVPDDEVALLARAWSAKVTTA
jgi:O-antigen biosynthesis protein